MIKNNRRFKFYFSHLMILLKLFFKVKLYNIFLLNFQLKETEKRDAVLTSKQQIDRLLRPGSSYANLNPFQVLQIDPRTSIEDIKTKFKRVRGILLIIF